MEEKKSISKVEKRWIVRELEAGRMSIADAKEIMGSQIKAPDVVLSQWKKQYASEIS